MLLKEIKKLEKTELKNIVDKRLKEFKSLGKKPNPYWFSELCFCILTANSKARTAIKIQEELGPEGFLGKNKKYITDVIKKHKHRFHNNKAEFIVEARKHSVIKDEIRGMNSKEAREFIVKNIKGLGYKESSHFLRNVGYANLAILDRHILNLMADDGIIQKPKSLTKSNYIAIEKEFKKLAKKAKMTCAELDLYMWYMKAGEVLK